MSTTPLPESDERTVAVENASCGLAYLFLTIALLIDVIYRNIVYHEDAWDLMALIIVGGAIRMVYKARKKVKALPNRRMLMGMLIGLVVAGIIMAAISLWYRN